MIGLNQRDSGARGTTSSARSGNNGNLLRRIASASVLVPVTLGAAYVGGWTFFVLCAAAAAAIVWEWAHLIDQRADARLLLPGLGALFIALLLTGAGWPVAAMGTIAIGALATWVVMMVQPRRDDARRAAPWAGAGVIYGGVAFLGPALLRRDVEFGFIAILYLAGIVWLTDILAYFVGRGVGGPRLCPSLSPNKTWAGAVGGLAGGVVGGVCVAYASGLGRVAVLGVMALLLSLLAQLGDLLESAVKRHFGAKDAGQIIPGHGGLMDRLDGFLVAAFAALLIGILRQGTDAPAQGLLVW